ncbi:hypothetical protein HF521_002281 [Silurus meridionalis]|uniref:Integrase core domain-containing protein n=1 Tax=Silurus meridionalis TaxID=175797 RepID=A0A8T0B8P3_SILME|nr:hypothetical protein HF521_002281 [Silurus meridionalis]
MFNLNRSVTYSDVTDDAVDDMIKDIVARIDQLGSEAVRAQLRAGGVQYSVAGPNSLGHTDGNHKLIRWRIVIHGGIDGYSRLIVFLHALNNNRSTTVMNCFLNAVARYGVPSRVRTAHGGENNDVYVMMNIFRGSERGSAIRGRSPHNQLIERLWGDMWQGLTNVYYILFQFLESKGIVDIDNEMHLWALHYVYLPKINRDLTAFIRQWNIHGLRTERHQTPMQIFVRGCLEQQGQRTTAMQEIFGRGAGSAAETVVQGPS